MVKKYSLLLLLGLCFCLWLSAKEGDDTRSFLDEWRETVHYGIDREILEVIKKLKSLKETALNNELKDLLARSVSTEIRTSILDFFTAVKYTEAEDIAVVILKNYDNEDPGLLRAVLIYLSEIGSKKGKSTIVELIDHDNDSISMGALIALGKLGDQSEADILLEKLDDAEFPESRKSQIIVALGEVGSKKAVNRLIEIVKNRSEDKVWRMYACEALGKIKDASAIPVIKTIFAENDPLLKAYAASALANFNMSDVLDILIQGLKDNYWKVRVASAKGLARPEGAPAIDILKYKAQKDPEGVVRREAIKALGAIGTGEAFNALRDLFEDDGQTMDIRETAFSTLVDHDLSHTTIASIEKVIILSKERNNTKTLDFIARKLSATKSGNLRSIYIIFLESSYFVLRIHGIRGVVINRIYDLRMRIEELSKDDPNTSVQKEALSALDKM
ncbi:MAG: HEAT repeat domain-containing protein [Spirochaetales bacterium]|nr:HEAT repeat domain-containing protein [Spirochaetales bacterium]